MKTMQPAAVVLLTSHAMYIGQNITVYLPIWVAPTTTFVRLILIAVCTAEYRQRGVAMPKSIPGTTFRSGMRMYCVQSIGATSSGLDVAYIVDITTKQTRSNAFPWPLWIVERECARGAVN
jgi:hypothetical protein